MNKKLLLYCIISLISFNSFSQEGKFSLNKDWRTAASAEVYAGASFSFAFGKYIKYQKTFHDVTNSNTDIKGNINPIIFFCAGTGLRYKPFNNGILTNLSVALGFGYLKRGFTNKYVTEYSDPTNDITDVTTFKERYSLHVLSTPLSFRWGKKWFAEIGFSYDRIFLAERKQIILHEVTGSDAYLGGFDTKASEKEKISKSLINRGTIGVSFGGGMNFSDKYAIRLTMHLSGKTFNSGDDFMSFTPQLQMVVPVTSLFKKFIEKKAG